MKTPSTFFRFVSLATLIAFTVLSCGSPFLEVPPVTPLDYPNKPAAPIQPAFPTPPQVTIGEGTPMYAYFSGDGTLSDTDTGKTAFFIENNENAKGFLAVSDNSEESADGVHFMNSANGALVTMFFRKNADFPYRMCITQNEKRYMGYFSAYQPAAQTYNLSVESGGRYETKLDLVLNAQVFSLYQNDDELTPSQNQRLRNIIIGLGLWASLAFNLYEEESGGLVLARGLFSTICGTIGQIFSAIAGIALTVAVVAAPIVAFVNPAAALAAAQTAELTAAIAAGIGGAAFMLGRTLDEDEKHSPPPTNPSAPAEPSKPVITVRKTGAGLMGHDEIFHIGPNVGDTLTFTLSVMNFSSTSIQNVKPPSCYEPAYPVSATMTWSRIFPVTITGISGDPGGFQLKIERLQGGAVVPNDNQDGQLYYGVTFTDRNDNTINNLVINDNASGFMFRAPGEAGPSLHKDTVVIHVCAIPDAHTH
jgi:hypothetical protein